MLIVVVVVVVMDIPSAGWMGNVNDVGSGVIDSKAG